MNTIAFRQNKIDTHIILIAVLFISMISITPAVIGQKSIKQSLQSIQDSIQKHYQNDPAKALNFAIEYKALANTSDSLIYKAKADNFLGMCYYVNGKIEPAISSYISSMKMFENLKDTWYVAMLNNNIGAAYRLRNKPHETISYYLKKKDADVVTLHSQNEIKSLQIKQSNNVKWGLFFDLCFASMLAFLAWRLKNLKSKNNVELAHKNTIIIKALDDKNILLREIHHRVKNNLQVISSLLKLQSQYIEDAGAVKAIAEGRNRVHSMALLHQNLYKEDNLTGVNMKKCH